MRNVLGLFILLALWLRVAAAQSNRPAPHVRMISVTRSVRLEVIDWGGGEHSSVPPLVFLSGLGNTAHVFDTFAPRFTGQFHVIGITRRGFGASADLPPPVDLDTLVADITGVLDDLMLKRVILVGHSIAGEEMTRFAQLHSDRCAGLIYLDAAYNRWGDTLAKHQPPTPMLSIQPSDTATFASVSALYARILGVHEPASEIRATNRFDERGHFRGRVTSDRLTSGMLSDGLAAQYDSMRSPALAIYAVPDSIEDVVPYYRGLDAQGRKAAEVLMRFVRAVVDDSRARFARLPERMVVNIRGSNHDVFLEHPREVEHAMRSFLKRFDK